METAWRSENDPKLETGKGLTFGSWHKRWDNRYIWWLQFKNYIAFIKHAKAYTLSVKKGRLRYRIFIAKWHAGWRDGLS